jgi:ribosomal protein S18 acetylase RimI-like enzyme
MHIEQISEVTEELYKAIQSLVPQLGPHKVAPSWEELTRLVSSESSALLIARETYQSGRIVGMLCLTVYRVPTGLRSVIEDVVVDEAARGRGIGAALIREAIERARAAGADGISLTSNPQREAANRLYQSIGFQLRQTNPYFYKLK